MNGAQARRRAARAAAALTIAALGVSLATGASAAEIPLWEFGLGAGAVAFSDYRGADSSSVYVLPVPIIAYHGQFLKADRNG